MSSGDLIIASDMFYICFMSAVHLGICVLFDCLYYLMAYIYCLITAPPVVKKPMEHDLPIGENVITPSVSLGTLPSIKSFDEISTMPYKHFDTCINQIKRRPMKNTDLSRGN